jgi:CDGSH-type Zn-finger protein
LSASKEKTTDDTRKKSEEIMSIKVSTNGPYIVKGNIPLLKMAIEADDEGYPCRWVEVEKYPNKDRYTLCRCGESKSKPYCDNSHRRSGFDGTETAGYAKFLEDVKIFKGPELILKDKKVLCVDAGFCTRAGDIWNLTAHSDIPKNKNTAIQEAADCPSGRLVLWDKNNNLIEPDLEKTIVITEHEDATLGPIWVRGEILIESSENRDYEIRNRVTLCRCGKSMNKPFCDATHLDT